MTNRTSPSSATRVRAAIDTLELRRLLASFTVDLAAAEEGSNFHTINAAIAAAAGTPETDDLIAVAAGSFAEDVVVSTSVTLTGAGVGVDPTVGRTGPETILTGSFAVTAGGVIIDGFTILNGSSVGSPPAIAGVYIDASGVAVRNNILSGNGTDGTGIAVTANVGTGTTSLFQNIVEDFATGITVRAGGDTAIDRNVVRENAVTGIDVELTAAADPSAVTITGSTFDNAGVPQIVLGGGTAEQDSVSIANNSVALRGAAVYVASSAPTPLVHTAPSTFAVYRTTLEDQSLAIDLDVDGSSFGTYGHATLAGSVSADNSIVTYVPAFDFNGQTSFTFTTMSGGTGTVYLTVQAVNDSPAITTSIGTQNVTAGQTGTLDLASHFGDVDVNDTPADELTYSLGSGVPDWITIDPATGIVTFSPPAGLSAVGSHAVTVSVSDGDEAASQAVTLIVARASNVAPVFSSLPTTVTLAEDATGVVGTFAATDAEADDIVYSIVAGNDAGTFAIDPATGVVTLVGTLDAEATLSYTLTIRATDDGEPATATTDATLTINVTDVNEAAGTVAITGPSGSFEGTALTFTAVATDPDVTALFSYRWFVDDVEQVGQTSAIFSTTFIGPGSRVIKVIVIDRGGTPVEATKTVDILDAPPIIPLSLSAASVDEASSLTLTIGNIEDPISGGVADVGQLVIDWGDDSFTIVSDSSEPAVYAAILAGTPIAIAHTYADGANQAKTITVRIWDSTGHASSASTSVLVNNVAPTGNFVALTPSVPAGSSALLNWFGQSDVSAADRAAGLRYTYVLDNNGNGVYDVGETLIAGDGTWGGSVGNTSITVTRDFIGAAGSYNILGLLFDKDGSPFLTRSATVIVTQSPLRVISLGGDHSGFTVVFNQPFDKSVINLYDGTDASVDVSDIVVTRVGGQIAKGSIIWGADGRSFDYIYTGGILPAGNYNVTLRSGATGFRDLSGNLLDGDGNGSAGGNYTSTFGVNAPPGPVLSMPDFTRGPGQSVDVTPSNANSDLPVSVNTPITITSMNFQIRYNAELLTVRAPDAANGIADIYAGANLPAGWAVDYSVGNNVIFVSLTKTSPSTPDITAGSKELIRIRATVPNDPGIYGRAQYIAFGGIVVNGSSAIEGTADRAVHKVVYLGDANFDGTVNVADAALIQSVVLNNATGFDKYQTIDPVLIVDSTKNNAVDAQDATHAAFSGFTGGRPAEIPAFTPITLPISIGPDPTFSLGQFTAGAGGAVNVPIRVIDDARGVQAGSIRVNYDPSKLDLSNASPAMIGALLGAGWSFYSNVNEADGYVELAFYSGTALTGANALTGTLGTLAFAVAAGAADGATPLTIGTPSNLATSPTIFFDGQGGILATSAVSGAVVVDTTAPTLAAPATFNVNAGVQSITVSFTEDVSASIATLDFELLNQTTGVAVALAIASISADGKTVTLTFTNTGGVKSTVLTDGNYRFRVRAGAVADAAGNGLFVDADSTFFFANADATRDRQVNFDDLLRLAQNYGRSTGTTFADGDFNYDGKVDFDDLLILASHYNKTLAAPAAATSAATSTNTRKRTSAATLIE